MAWRVGSGAGSVRTVRPRILPRGGGVSCSRSRSSEGRLMLRSEEAPAPAKLAPALLAGIWARAPLSEAALSALKAVQY